MNDNDNINNNSNSIYIFKIKNSFNSNSNTNLDNIDKNSAYIYHPNIKNKEYIFWRDSNFEKLFLKSEHYNKFKIQCNQTFNMNIYCRSSIEKSLKFLLRNKYDKIILITNIGLDLSGKRYIEIARKILGFDIII